jgi:hypothetical protein
MRRDLSCFLTCLLVCASFSAIGGEGSSRFRFAGSVDVRGSATKVVISIVSIQREFRVNLTALDFDGRLKTTGPDYVLEISDRSRVERVISFLETLDVRESGGTADMDARYRIDVFGGGGLIGRAYVGKFGDIESQARRYEAVGNINWVSELGKAIAPDVFVLPVRPVK